MTESHTFPLPLDGPGTVLDRTAPTLIHPGSDAYDDARQAWNLNADQRPACVCVARSVEDVQAAVAYAREHALTVAAQSTGHLAQALPSLERTLLLKVALHGLAVMHGSSPSVGVVGYLLGGGLSFYGRRHGLAVNHVRAFQVVTPDGVVRRVDAEHNRELFYALRGGGGGYAIVTEVELGLLPYAEVTGGALFFGIKQAGAVLRAWRNWSAYASDDITTTFRLLCLPPLPEVPEPLRGVPTVCVNGVALDPAEAEGLEGRLRMIASPILGGFGPMPSAGVVRLHGDPEDPVAAIGDGMLLEKLDDWAIEAFLRVAGAGSGSPLVAAEIRQLGGALASPPPGAGARGNLEGSYLLFGVGIPGRRRRAGAS